MSRRGPATKRERASAAARRLGLIWLLERLPRRPCLLIFNYHRICDGDGDPYDPGLVEASGEEFDDQMGLLRKRYALTELGEVEEIVEHPSRLRHCRVMVTLDDGYRDNHDVAFPILKSHGIKAAFFLPTGFVGTRRIPWWDQVAYMIRRTEERVLRLRYPFERTIDLGTTFTRWAIQRVLGLYKNPDTTDPERFLVGLEEACRVARPREGPERLFMSWEEARTLMRAGMGIGSHTHTHELLAKLTPEQQLHECRLSRETIAEQLGHRVDSLAYPVGSRESVSPVTHASLRETGYRTAFSYYGGVNTADTLKHRFDVQRVRVASYLPRYRLKAALAAVTARDLW